MIVPESVGRIPSFLQGIASTRSLRVALVTDEAEGCRIVDGLLERQIDPGVMIVRLRLAPEVTVAVSPFSVPPLCGRHAGEPIDDPQYALRSLAVAIRRYSRLHPILLVIDDLDAVSCSLLGEFSLFLASLADETLSVLCRSALLEPALRGVVERYLLDEISLAGECGECMTGVGKQESRGVGAIPLDSAGHTARLATDAGRLDDDIARSIAAMASVLPAIADASVATGCGQRIELTMLGAIAVRRSDGSVAPIRGTRHGTVLGVLVIDRMLARPLSYREFCRLAAGDVDDPLRAQKIMNMGVRRLQTMLGDEAIIRDGGTPQLNLDVVSVDLLRAHQLLQEAVSTAGPGPVMRAVDKLTQALDIVHGAQLFPGLEGEMFNAAREDFNGTLRSAIIEVSRLLLDEGESAGVAHVLGRALDLLPCDPEITELLYETGRQREHAHWQGSDAD